MFVGIGVGVGRQRFGGGFDADYQAILNYAISQEYNLPSEENQILQNNLIVGLKNEGIWNLIDHLQVYPNNAISGSNFATINWINPNSGHNAIRVNSPSFNQYYGFSNVGNTDYVNTNINLATDSNNFEALNNMISVGFRQESNQTKSVNFGARISPTDKTQISAILYGGIFRYFGDHIDMSNFSVGFFNNNNVQAAFIEDTTYRYRDGVLLDAITLATFGNIPNFDFYILAINNSNSTQFNGSNGYVDHFMSGSGDIVASTFNTLISDYKTAILSL